MLKKLGIVLASAIVTVLVAASRKPDSFRVARSVSVAAKPEKVFPLVDDLRAQTSWSPWDKKDPGMKRSFSGPARGVGAVYEWDGNKDIGQGRIEIVESVAPARVVMKLDFIRPMEGRNVAAFELAPEGKATVVTWSISGPMPFLSKIMCVFMDMDTMIGRDFEAGLAGLKALAERA